ncbi:MAG: sigma-70 family RNA polymerase sigma factor [Acidobacteria bacterium]|nr:sigma-70 family RNA polymerase sigma factor [Acidobacteriota bacterium]
MEAAVDHCCRRVFSWRVPPNWSTPDWQDECKAMACAAAWQAMCHFDPQRGVPLVAFLYERALASCYTRYRQEWSYACRCIGEIAQSGDLDSDELSWVRRTGYSCQSVQHSLTLDTEEVQRAVSRLAERDQALIHQLYWEGKTEQCLGREYGVTQQAVSKRKRAILRLLAVCVRESCPENSQKQHPLPLREALLLSATGAATKGAPAAATSSRG